jgi:hypothetical protein
LVVIPSAVAALLPVVGAGLMSGATTAAGRLYCVITPAVTFRD